MRASVIALATVAMIAMALPAKAAEWPWCATTYGDSAVTTCGFTSLPMPSVYQRNFGRLPSEHALS
jgi:hypothetical protein